MLSHWPGATWWPADRNDKDISKSGAAAFLARIGSGLGSGLGLGPGLGLPPYLDPTRK